MLVAQELCQDQVALLLSHVGNVSEMGHTTYNAACSLSGDRGKLDLATDFLWRTWETYSILLAVY